MTNLRRKEIFKISEVSEITGLEETRIVSWIEREWISPPREDLLDEEDIARIRLIEELLEDFGVNEDAIPLVLHLVDQLYCLHEEQRKLLEKFYEQRR